jgi:putative acetyltransferase
MEIRYEISPDYPFVADVNILAFGRENEAKLVEEIRYCDRYIPELSLVAEVDGNIVGHVLFSYIDLVGEETLRVLGLAPVAVLPNFQRQGIGSTLTKVGLETADKMGEVLVIVLGDPQFYNRFGFVPSVVNEIESPFPVPEDFFMVKTLKNYQQNQQKYKGKVVYPDAFNSV